MNFAILNSVSLLSAIQVPENWVQMSIWYSVLLVCLLVFAFSMKRKRSGKSNQELQERIETLEEFEAGIVKEKAISRKELYSAIFQITIIRDYCKQTFESSQFTVYEEAGICLDNALFKIKDVELKKWNNEKTAKIREEISVELDKAGNFLRQAL